MSFAIRRLTGEDAASYRAIRLEGLAAHPEAFAASFEDEVVRDDAWFAGRLAGSTVFGGWDEDGGLAGVAGFLVPAGAKQRHKGILWGMYVRPQARGTGLAPALVAAVLDHARGLVEAVRLTVVADNAPAVRLYAAAGFVQYGLERRALRVGERYYDELLMATPTHPNGDPSRA